MSSMIPFDPYAALSQSPFGTSGSAPQWTPPAQPQPAPFNWGAAGSRLTPDQIAQKDKVAQALIAGGMDYSPVGSWTQGLARVAQGIMGAVDEKALDKDKAANTAADQAIMTNLLGGGSGSSGAALAAMTNPGASTGVRTAGRLVYENANRPPPQPGADEQLLIAAGLTPGTPEYKSAAMGLFQKKNDPFVTTSLPGGGFYGGPQSGLLPRLQGGGGQPSGGLPGTGASAAPPSAAVNALLSGEGTDAQFDEMFGPGAAAQARGGSGAAPASNMGIPANAVSPGGSTPTVLSRADAAPFMKSLGPQGFERWMAQHGIRLGN